MNYGLKEMRTWQVEMGGHGALLIEATGPEEAIRLYFERQGITACAYRPHVQEYPYLLMPEE